MIGIFFGFYVLACSPPSLDAPHGWLVASRIDMMPLALIVPWTACLGEV